MDLVEGSTDTPSFCDDTSNSLYRYSYTRILVEKAGLFSMCGICGVWSPLGQNPSAITKSLMTEIEHRGPDGLGIFDFQRSNLSLGHVRLSIIDLDGSPQPMTSASERFTIVFNGEIYNYEKLRTELDYPFQTSGDTETILALWEKEGPDCLAKLRGQYAFAIWDSESEIISFATDAFGILPIFVYDNGNTLAFSSSANSLANTEVMLLAAWKRLSESN